jgi:hypothetical protein
MIESPMKLFEGIPMRGDLRIVVCDALTGKQLRRIEIRNKITFLAADIMTELLAQRATDPTASYDQIWSMRMGLSNTPASRADQNLGSFHIGKQLYDVNKITGVPGELEFTATLAATEANGVTLQEAALFTRGDAVTPTPSDLPGTAPGKVRMFCRQIHPAVPKTSAIVINYSWRLAFTA